MHPNRMFAAIQLQYPMVQRAIILECTKKFGMNKSLLSASDPIIHFHSYNFHRNLKESIVFFNAQIIESKILSYAKTNYSPVTNLLRAEKIRGNNGMIEPRATFTIL